MKKFALLLSILLSLTSTSHSQIPYVIEKDTNVCFTIPQFRYLSHQRIRLLETEETLQKQGNLIDSLQKYRNMLEEQKNVLNQSYARVNDTNMVLVKKNLAQHAELQKKDLEIITLKKGRRILFCISACLVIYEGIKLYTKTL